MQVLFFISDFKIGLAHLLLEQAISFKEMKGVDFIYISGENEQEKGLREKAVKNGIHVHIIDGLDTHKEFFRLAFEIQKIIKETETDIVHVQNNWQLALISYLRYFKRQKIKIVYTVHGYRNNFKIKSIVARYIIMIALFFTAAKVLVSSTYVRKRFFLIRNKSILLFLGLGEQYFSLKSPVPQSERKVIIFAGKFRKGKNQQLIINALARYIDETKDSNIHLHLPGTGSFLEDCKHLAKKLCIEEFVTFPGQLTSTEVFDLYQQCNIAVIPSNTETFGHCIAEPFALGFCVFTRKTGVAEDIIKNGSSGLFFYSEDDLYRLFLEYLPYPEKLRLIGKSAFEHRDILRFSNIALQYKSIIELIK